MIAPSKTLAVQLKASASAGILAAALLFVNSVALAEDTSAPATPAVQSEAKASTDGAGVSSQSELMIGDKIQVSFFEQFNLGRPGDAGLSADARTFYQRLDLTGEHVVGSDGAISIPLLGRFVVSGMTPQEAGAQIVDAYRDVMGRTAEVNLAIMERRPVYVTGIVKAPGSFRFEPGMMVLQAVALAGGYDTGAAAASRLIDAQRERERHDQAVDHLQRLVVKRDRLIQQRETPVDGEQQKQTQLLDNGESPVLVEGETRLLRAEQAAFVGDEGLQRVKLANAEGQVTSLNNLLDLLGQQIDVRSERLRVLQQAQGRGFSSIEILWNAQKDVNDLRMQRERLTAELGAAKQYIVQAAAEGEKRVTDYRVQIERQLSTIEEEISQQENIVDASSKMITALETANSGVPLGQPLQVKIVRRTPARTEIMQADETSGLFPGDVVKVEVMSSNGDVVSSNTPIR